MLKSQKNEGATSCHPSTGIGA